MKSAFSWLRRAALVAFACVFSPAFAAGGVSFQYFVLTWTPPIDNDDGTALSDLLGYYIYSGNSPDSMVVTYFTNADTPGIVLRYPPAGRYYFAVSAVNVSGIESAMTPLVSNIMP
jgi:hypothetical protein